MTVLCNDYNIGYRIQQLEGFWNHPNATRAPQYRQTRASGENLNYVTLAPQARQARASGENFNHLTLEQQARLSGEILNYSLRC